MVQEAVVIISEDLKHDGHAVQHFVNQTMPHLRNNRGVTVNKVIEFTDGCGSQYKSKLPFSDISFSGEDMAVKRERHHSGSCHGKGPSDGVSAKLRPCFAREFFWLSDSFIISYATMLALRTEIISGVSFDVDKCSRHALLRWRPFESHCGCIWRAPQRTSESD